VSLSLSEPKFTIDISRRLHRGRARQIVEHQVIHASVKELEGKNYRQKAKPSGEEVIYESDDFERARQCVVTLAQTDKLGRWHMQTPPEDIDPGHNFCKFVEKSEHSVCTFLFSLSLNRDFRYRKGGCLQATS
jgi:hypothetical protein